MKVVIQRCNNANVVINHKENRSIDRGLVIFLGITNGDTESDIEYLIKKITNLRIFEDDNNKMNYSVKDINGSVMLISQFTLYANTKKGNRPSFENSLEFNSAKKLYEIFANKLKKEIQCVTGEFGEHMDVSLVNDGPVTIIIDTMDIKEKI